MAGILRSIAELENLDPTNYKGWIGIVLVADGAREISADFLNKAKQCKLIDLQTLEWKSKVMDKAKN